MLERNSLLPLLSKMLHHDWYWNATAKNFIYHPYFEKGYNYFINWRKKNKKFPVHYCSMDCLFINNFKWNNLLDSDISTQPHFQWNEKEKLSNLNMIIIGISIGQLNTENIIDEIMKKTFLRAIDREMHSALIKLYPKNTQIIRKALLAQLFKSVKNIKEIKLRTLNDEIFNEYYSPEEE